MGKADNVAVAVFGDFPTQGEAVRDRRVEFLGVLGLEEFSFIQMTIESVPGENGPITQRDVKTSCSITFSQIVLRSSAAIAPAPMYPRLE